MNASSPHLDLADLLAEVNGDAVPRAVRVHLAACPDCRAETGRWASVAAGVRQLAGASALPPLLPMGFPAQTRDAQRSPGGRARLSSLVAAGGSARRALPIAAAVTVLAVGGVSYGLARGHGRLARGGPVAAAGLIAVNGCPRLAAGLGMVEQASAASLVIRTSGGQLVTVTASASAKVSREAAGSVSDITDGARIFVRGVYAGGSAVAHSITVGVPRRLPAPAIGWQSPSPTRPFIAAGTVRDVSGSTFVLVVPGGRHVAVTARGSAAVFSLAPATLSQIGTGDYVVAVGKAAPGGGLVAAAVEAGNSLPHNRGTGISELPQAGCRPSAITTAASITVG
jgi:hypothetical protein